MTALIFILEVVIKTADLNWSTKTFKDNNERDIFINDVKKSLKHWAENWGGFKEIPKEEPKKGIKDIFQC